MSSKTNPGKYKSNLKNIYKNSASKKIVKSGKRLYE
jgi:hypothetical protein